MSKLVDFSWTVQANLTRTQVKALAKLAKHLEPIKELIESKYHTKINYDNLRDGLAELSKLDSMDDQVYKQLCEMVSKINDGA